MCGGPGPKLCARRPGVGPLGDPGLAAGGVWGGVTLGLLFGLFVACYWRSLGTWCALYWL